MNDVYKYLKLVAVLFILPSCDAVDPSFTVEEVDSGLSRSEGEALPQSRGNQVGQSNNAGSNRVVSQVDEPTLIIKDNGKSPDAGGTIPERLLDRDKKAVEKSLINSTTSISETINELADGSMTVSPSNLYQEESLVHVRTLQDKSSSVDQNIRDNNNESSTQGYTSAVFSEIFNQTESGVLDILIVIDDSGSMNVEQQLVAANLPSLLTYIKDSKWRIAVVTTGNGRLTGVISKGDTDPEAKFSQAIAVGAAGNGNEKGIQYAKEGLLKLLPNGTSWLRPDSSVAILIVSDEDNCSDDGKGCGTNPYAKIDYLTSYISTIRPATNPVKVHGLFWHPDETRDQCPSGYNKGKQYAQVVQLTGGTWGSICSSDYSAVLSNISSNLNLQLQNQFNLSYLPVAGTFSLVVKDENGQPLTVAYTRNDTTITFSEEVPANSTIEVSYRYVAAPITDTFALANRPALETLQVSWTDKSDPASPVVTVKTASEYDVISVLDSSNVEKYSVKFKDGHVPPEKATVDISYRTYGTLITELPMSCDYELKADESVVKVFTGMPGVQLDASKYSVSFADKKVVFNSGYVPADGVNMSLKYQCYKKVFDYSYLGSATTDSLYVYKESTKEQVAVTVENSQIRFPPDSFSLGDTFKVRNLLDFQAALRGSIEPMQKPILESIVVSSNNVGCDTSLVKYEGGRIDISACGFEKTQYDVNITYKYITKTNLEFEIDQKFFEKAHKTQIWRVSVDDNIVMDYEIDGNKILLSELLATQNAKQIKIEVTLVNEN